MNQANGRLTEVTVPHLAESLVSATVGKWLKKPGDYIEQYDVLCELFTEKVNTEMPSPIEGRLVKIIVGDGETAAVGEAICLIEESAGSAGASTHQAVEAESYAEGAAAESVDQSMRGRYSPAVQRLAQENQVDLTRVAGTGLGGRITRKDVEQYIAGGGRTSAPTQAAPAPAAPAVPAAEQRQPAAMQAGSAPIADVQPANLPVRSSGIHLSANPQTPLIEAEGYSMDARNEHFIDVTPIRNAIASKMRQSVTEIPHAWTMIEVDVTNLVVLRNKVKDEFMRREGINLTYLAFMLKAVVNAIKDYPIINSVWAVDKIIVKRDINISLSVGTEDSVLTPVIKKADQKNIAGLAREIDELTKKTRAGKLSLNDMVGGTFTVNNTGSFGSILSYPIINYPQAAIVTFESIVKKPVVIQDMIAVRSMVNLCLSLDHRILDGVICGRFLQRVKENLESYNADTKIY
ncbi:dihydrolipoamide acetyltransferase family protein [Paenibacillus sp. GCM10023248]|uniref:dihydrolipoamide acetyltransferase family protein n=1 Tax=Bacillales TaxID=1385 RepID=UPI0023793DD1|nr:MULTISPECIES: dihydrolipoamide acetyltransferase family protein [Bacillales]MDD9267552.1 dihydrolipoamide acetyltransferase family protein [Paenibacillus sp. MAHUQ-63]MDR6882769.1 2-oxoisovalerate dehydrogenase E2 component (dihydrolipoyl transacylase) [Bacillus sp. 3255]